MNSWFGQRVGSILPLLVVIMIFGCSGGGSSGPKAEKPTESAKDRPPNFEPAPRVQAPSPKADKPTEPAKDHPDSEPKPPAREPLGLVSIDSFLGISPDFKAYAISDGKGVKVVSLETGKQIASPTWDQDWGSPYSVAFSEDAIAVVTIHNSSFAVKIFSRKTGELEQNVHGDQIDRAEFSAGGRLLVITEFRSGKGYYLVLHDIQMKKTVAEVHLGGGGSCSLAVSENRVATYEPDADQITIVGAKTGAVVKKIKSGSFRKTKESGQGRMPLAISPAGNLLACEAEDDIVLYDIDGGKVAQKLEGHLDVVGAVGFSPNGETVASAANDKTIRFWNVKEGKEANAIKNVPTGACELIFSADGKKIAVVYSNRLGGEFTRPRKAEIRNTEPK